MSSEYRIVVIYRTEDKLSDKVANFNDTASYALGDTPYGISDDIIFNRVREKYSLGNWFNADNYKIVRAGRVIRITPKMPTVIIEES